MSPKIFSQLASEHPELSSELKIIRRWVVDHPHARYMDPRSWKILFQNEKISFGQFPRLLEALLSSGHFAVKYAVAGPDKTIRSELYNEVSDIPERVAGAFGREFNADEGTVLSVLVESPRESEW